MPWSDLRVSDTDHAVAGDDRSEFLPAPVFGAGRAPGENEVAKVGGAVVNAHDHAVGKVGAEFA